MRPLTRRALLHWAAIPLGARAAPEAIAASSAPALRPRARPGHPGWPSDAQWAQLRASVDDALIKVRSPFDECAAAPTSKACELLFKQLKNPYFLGDEVGLTQTLGWVDAWVSMPSAYAVAARSTADVVAAVNFARQHKLRLAIKGGGHSYQGTSNAADSLLIWTRRINEVRVVDSFVPQGAGSDAKPIRAVTVGAGALWGHVYDVVTAQAGGYVQGGGCMTVGVAGLIQSGGFGSFSKSFGLAAASLLEAEVVTADGVARTVNRHLEPDLLWALKGGGGCSLGVITRLTLRVHELPSRFGAVNMTIRATSDAAFRRLVGAVIDLYADRLFNPHWGEQIRIRPGNQLQISMVFQGLERSEAQALWASFMDFVDGAPHDFSVDFSPLKIVTTSAREFWSPTLVKRLFGFIASDDRPGAPKENVFWPGDVRQAGQYIHGYQSAWLPAKLLLMDRRQALCDALFAASRHWGVSLHVNKGLAGAPPQAIAAARNTAINPAVLDAFALLICGAEEQPCYPGVAGREPNVAAGRQRAKTIARAMDEVRRLVPDAGSYVSESDFFIPDWQRAFWGDNYARLSAVKGVYDPEGLFAVHHGVGSERWSADGRTPAAGVI